MRDQPRLWSARVVDCKPLGLRDREDLRVACNALDGGPRLAGLYLCDVGRQRLGLVCAYVDPTNPW